MNGSQLEKGGSASSRSGMSLCLEGRSWSIKSDGGEKDRRIGASSAVMRALSPEAKLSVSVFFAPTTTLGPTIWAVTDSVRSETRVAELRVEPLLRGFSWLGCPLVASLWRLFGHVQLGAGPGADPEHAGGIVYPLWAGFPLQPAAFLTRPQKIGRKWMDVKTWTIFDAAAGIKMCITNPFLNFHLSTSLI